MGTHTMPFSSEYKRMRLLPVYVSYVFYLEEEDFATAGLTLSDRYGHE